MTIEKIETATTTELANGASVTDQLNQLNNPVKTVEKASDANALNVSLVPEEQMVQVIEMQGEAAALPESTPARKTPQEILAEIRAASAAGLKPHEIAANKRDGKTLNDLIIERKQRNEEIYCDKLRAEGKQIYAPSDVTAIGYKFDPSWTQEDMQSRMLYGPVLLPLQGLQMKADEYHQSFVIPGRKAVMEIMGEVYRLFLLAMVPERCEVVFAAIRSRVEAKLKKKLAEDASFGSQFIRFVFTEFDDRKVHLYARAVEFAYSSNVSADAFKGWVEGLGGWEKVRQEAANAFNCSPEVLLAREEKQAIDKEAKSLIERWKKLRGVVDTVQINGKLSKKLGSQPGKFLLEVTWWPMHHPSEDVYAGHFEVMDILPTIDAVIRAVQESRVEEAKLEKDRLTQLVEQLDAEAYNALDDETKARYDELSRIREANIASSQANHAAHMAELAARDALKSFA